MRLGGFGRGDLGSCLFFGLRLFQVFDRQFELLDEKLAALGGLAKTLMAGLGEHELQPLDLQRTDLGLLLGLAQRRLSLSQHLALCDDHRVRARQVAREPIAMIIDRVFGGVRHNNDNSIFCVGSRQPNSQ